jgi:mitochondrial fission protein ELM1
LRIAARSNSASISTTSTFQGDINGTVWCANSRIARVNDSPPNARSDAAVWVISDGAAGNERQALALAQALQLAPTVMQLDLRAPWRWLAPRFLHGARWSLPRDIRLRCQPPWPALAIGCGRQAALLTRTLRHASAGKTFTVQILDPRIDPAQFDLVIAPRHDELAGPNVIQTLGALNSVDERWLAEGLARFPTLAQLPQPRTTVLLGGPRRGLGQDDAWFGDFMARVAALVARDGGTILIASSRRTPEAWRTRMRERLRADCLHFWNGPGDGANPYQGYLAAADRIVVTPDSVNMLCEACAAGAPVLSLLPEAARGRIVRLHDELQAQGWLHELDPQMDFSTLVQPPPLRELAAVATKIWHVLESTRPELAVALAGS